MTGFVLGAGLGGITPWAVVRGPDGAPRSVTGTGLVGTDLVPLPLLSLAVVVTFAGLVAAPLFGLAAVPGARWARWVVTVVLLGMLATVAVVALQDAADQAARPYADGDAAYTETVAILAVVFAVPTALLVLLTWVARRGAAITAAVAAYAAAAAHLATLALLVVYPPEVVRGAWLQLLAVAVSAGGAWLLVRTTPRRPRTAPALQPGDPGWTAA
ncbi:hypothetical protein SAMN05660199_04617 [Klenkia soli]|uniref:DUF998 domain-containing protein n=1 Tax=Klenkia soli TaxID=1052260 RepID=A0A1H0USE3_9ACTN|nr:hypothetical protein SAMN05660199_04617 [Klenkia soli]